MKKENSHSRGSLKCFRLSLRGTARRSPEKTDIATDGSFCVALTIMSVLARADRTRFFFLGGDGVREEERELAEREGERERARESRTGLTEGEVMEEEEERRRDEATDGGLFRLRPDDETEGEADTLVWEDEEDPPLTRRAAEVLATFLARAHPGEAERDEVFRERRRFIFFPESLALRAAAASCCSETSSSS